MSKIDFKKTLKHLYQPPRKFVEIEIPPMQYLMIDGQGSPGPEVSQEYQDAVEALYSVAYKIKFMSKLELKRDYVVPPLEGLWWAEDMTAYTRGDRDAWLWTMMIMQPDWITQEIFNQACIQIKKAKDPAALPKMRLDTLYEGLCVQIMHIGSYAEEAPTLSKLHNEYMPARGLTFGGHHHEIYLGDPRRIAPEKLKTVLRQSVRRI